MFYHEMSVIDLRRHSRINCEVNGTLWLDPYLCRIKEIELAELPTISEKITGKLALLVGVLGARSYAMSLASLLLDSVGLDRWVAPEALHVGAPVRSILSYLQVLVYVGVHTLLEEEDDLPERRTVNV